MILCYDDDDDGEAGGGARREEGAFAIGACATGLRESAILGDAEKAGMHGSKCTWRLLS